MLPRVIASILAIIVIYYVQSEVDFNSFFKKEDQLKTSSSPEKKTPKEETKAAPSFEELKDNYQSPEMNKDYIADEKIIEAQVKNKLLTTQLLKKNYNVQINQIDNSNFPKIRLVVSVSDKQGNPIVVNPEFFQIIEHGKVIPKNKVLKIEKKDGTEKYQELFPLNIILAIDKSGSMIGSSSLKREEQPLYFAIQSVLEFINQSGLQDKVEVLAFDGDIHYLGQNMEAVYKLQSLQAKGSTALYGVLLSSVKRLQEGRGTKAVILLSDGKNDTRGTINKNLKKVSLQQGLLMAEQLSVPVFTISFGEKSDDYVLKEIAKATHASFFKTIEKDEIPLLYKKIRKILNSQYIIEYMSYSLEEVTDVIFRLGEKQDQRSFQTPSFILKRHEKLLSEIKTIEEEKNKLDSNKVLLEKRFETLKNLEQNLTKEKKLLDKEMSLFFIKKSETESLQKKLTKMNSILLEKEKDLKKQEDQIAKDSSDLKKKLQEVKLKEKDLQKKDTLLSKKEKDIYLEQSKLKNQKENIQNTLSKLKQQEEKFNIENAKYQKDYEKYLKLKKDLEDKTKRINKEKTKVEKTLSFLKKIYNQSLEDINKEIEQYKN